MIETLQWLVNLCGICVVASPAALLLILGGAALIGKTLREELVGRLTFFAVITGLLASMVILATMLALDQRHVVVELGNWVVIPAEEFHFHNKLIFDRLSIPFAILSFVLCGTVSAFASQYLHREPGHRRFFLLNAFFLLGIVVTAVAGTIELLFFGWELVGLSSALLVAFFHERPAPPLNGLRVWSVYRIADAAFLLAAVALHHLTGAGDFDGLMGAESWPDGHASLTASQALFVGSLLLAAAIGKSAIVPCSGWLPRAMEGPTPSIAIFYGALSVHLGAYLLLRVSPVLEASMVLSMTVVALGLITALFAAVTTRVQTDIKSSLAFASLTQVGIIVAEIGIGLRYVALVHLLGHACLRTLQLLRAPTLLRDYHTLEDAIGRRLDAAANRRARGLSSQTTRWIYRFAFDRGFLDTLLDAIVVNPFLRIMRQCDTFERIWTDWLTGKRSRESDEVELHAQVIEELRL